jgi:hypothetical protein
MLLALLACRSRQQQGRAEAAFGRVNNPASIRASKAAHAAECCSHCWRAGRASSKRARRQQGRAQAACGRAPGSKRAQAAFGRVNNPASIGAARRATTVIV